jgi:hypothetical protein
MQPMGNSVDKATWRVDLVNATDRIKNGAVVWVVFLIVIDRYWGYKRMKNNEK